MSSGRNPSSPDLPMSSAEEAGRSRRRIAARNALIVLAALAMSAGSRLYCYREPLERDIATYAVFAHEVRDGKWLYRDLWNNYPPMIFATFGAAESIVPYGRGQVLFLNLLASTLTLLAIYSAGRAAGGIAGPMAALFWGLIGADPLFEANQPNTEAFLNACLSWSFALMVGSRPGKSGSGRAILIGLTLSAAIFYKPLLVAMAGILACIHAANPPEGVARRRWAILQLSTIVAVGIAAGASLIGYLAATGRLNMFLDAVVRYNQYYAGNLATNLARSFSLSPNRLFPPILRSMIPLAVFSAIAVFSPPARRLRALLVGYIVATQISIAWTGQFFPHYYQLWLPPLSIGAGWGLVSLGKLGRPRLATTLAIFTALALFGYEARWYRRTPELWSVAKYGPFFARIDRLAGSIDEILAPGETFYQWGDELGLYFMMKVRPPVDPVWRQHLSVGPGAETRRSRVIRDLMARPPDLVVVPRLPAPDGPLAAWLESRYRHFQLDPAVDDESVLYALRGSPLEARLQAAGRLGPR